jgi:hypothetical protein
MVTAVDNTAVSVCRLLVHVHRGSLHVVQILYADFRSSQDNVAFQRMGTAADNTAVSVCRLVVYVHRESLR